MKAKRLVNLIETAIGELSRNEFCKKARISAGNFSRIMQGQRPTPDILERIAGASDGKVTYEQLMLAAEYIENKTAAERGIPIYGVISAGSPIEAIEDIQGYVTLDYPCGGAAHPGNFALRVNGDSMNAMNIPDGCVVIVHPQEDIKDGEVAAVLVNGDATIKRIYRTDEHLMLMPASLNPIHQPQIYSENDDVRLLGKVVMSLVDIE